VKLINNRLAIMQAVVLFASVALGVSSSHAEESEVPKWVKTIKLKGDLRLRYQLTTKDAPGKEIADRSRARVRARIGIGAKIADGIKVGIGITSGGDDPRSTNQTLDGGFSSKGFQLDYAYAALKLSEPITVVGGKFARKKAVWHPSDLLWDSDINVEGASVAFEKGTLFLNAGGFILEEEKNSSDPSLYVVQPGIKTKAGDFSIKIALAYYVFGGVQGRSIDFSSKSNSLIDPADKDSGLLYDYDVIAPAVEIAVKNPMSGTVPHAALFGEYVKNSDPSDLNTGFLVGFKVGNKKVKKAKQWQFKYLYRELEKDAWLDALPDSDFAGGKTGYKGHELIAQAGIKKNAVFAIDYYRTEEINGSKEEEVVQVDFNFKF